MFIGGLGPGQFPGLVIHIMVTLAGPIDAIGPMQPGIEPLWAVGCRHLLGQHIAHFVKIAAGIVRAVEIATFPAPIGPGTGQTIKNLRRLGFAATAFTCWQIRHRSLIRHTAPQEIRNILFLNSLCHRRNTGLAEVLLGDHIASDLAEMRRNFDILQLKDDRTIGVTNFRIGLAELDRRIGRLVFLGEPSFNTHLKPNPLG